MQSFSGTRAAPHDPNERPRIHSALTSFADECCGTLARLVLYVGALALLAIVGLHFWDELPARDIGPAARAVWSPATRSYPAFAVSQPESFEKTASYEILRHPGGGRKDVLRWAAAAEKPVAELEIYRPGDEESESGPALAELADRMDPNGARELEAAGIIDSKFGAVTLLRLAGLARGDAPACLGFLKRLDQADLRISGWSCHGELLNSLRKSVSLPTPLPTVARDNGDRTGSIKRKNVAATERAADADVWTGAPAFRPDGLRHRRAQD